VVEWVVVVPVKGTAGSKSRLDASAELARAIALDTVEAALAVGHVIVVTNAASAADFVSLGARVVDDPGAGLNAAIAVGVDAAGPDVASAVLLGDHPALTSAELREALAVASRVPRALVADADGTGSALTTALPGVEHYYAFGSGSRNAHAAAGYLELDGDWPGLRRDVDTAADLEGLDLGPRTRSALGN
jgi:2-phospho-L-lactate guanylyltransferase